MQEQRRQKLSRDEVGIGQCKQCGGPVTDQDQVPSDVGIFCSVQCRDQYEGFTRRAAAMEAEHGKPRPRMAFMLKVLFKRLMLLVIALIALGVIALLVEAPVLSPFVRNLLGRGGL